MNSRLKEIIDDDINRYGCSIRGIKPLYLRWQICYRKASFYDRKSLLGIFYRIKLRLLSDKSGIQIPTKACVGRGLFFGHNGRIIVNPDVHIGNNVNIGTGVTIGKTNRGNSEGVPYICDEVWIGTNAVIVGGIRIETDVMIAPGAFVNFDVPQHSVVVGNPGVIHHKEYATEGYINNKVSV